MPRIRTIKPDAFKSDTLSEVSVLARWTFAGLWTYCDDYGKARDDARLIKAELFPIDDSTSLARVKEALLELEESGAICRYQALGKSFLHCPKWSDHQRVSHPTASKIPDCPKDHLTCTLEDSGTAPESVGKAPETLRPERKGKEQGTGKGPAARRAEQIPNDWQPNDQHASFAAENQINLSGEAEQFRDHHIAKGSTMKDWDAAFRTWLRNAVKFRKEAPATTTRHLRRAEEIEQPPPNLSDAEYSAWLREQRERRHA